MQTFLYTLHFIVCFVLIGVVLLQRGKGADLGASLGGGGANTIFGSRGAGNFLSKITTASAVIFMGTSLSLSYLGYQASDVQLFDETQPFDVPGATPALPDAGAGALEEIPSAASDTSDTSDTSDASDTSGGVLIEVPDSLSESAADVQATIQEGLQEVEEGTE